MNLTTSKSLRRIFISASAAAIAIAPQSASAALITYNFAGGKLTSKLDGTGTQLAGTGSQFSGSFTYDTSVASYYQYTQLPGYGTTASYQAVNNFALSSGTLGVTASTGSSVGTISVQNNYNIGSGPQDEFSLSLTSGLGSLYSVGIQLKDTSATTFLSSALPNSLSANSFTRSLLTVQTASGFFYGTIDSLTAVPAPVSPVPEPATWAMMILGFGFIGGALRRHSRNVAVA